MAARALMRADFFSNSWTCVMGMMSESWRAAGIPLGRHPGPCTSPTQWQPSLPTHLEDGDGGLELLAREELGGLCEVHLVGQLGEPDVPEASDAPVVPGLEPVPINLLSDQLGAVHDDPAMARAWEEGILSIGIGKASLPIKS